jgi:SET domain-containing protein
VTAKKSTAVDTATPVKTSSKKEKAPVYEVRESAIQGRGGFAVRPIRTGKRIDEYVGEKISHKEADRRYDDNEGRHHTFLFVLDDDVVLDARFGGNNARFLNHSCDPNCETVIENNRVWIKAIKPIKPDDELLYDYRFEWQDEYEPEDIRYYACRCGTDKCRGTIVLVPKYLRPTVAKWLAGEDVPKPRKPKKKKGAKKGKKKDAKKDKKKGSKKDKKKDAKKGKK